ncbi:Methyltransferase type 12 [Rhodopirellula sallentina SM41]|uniref:Methyltransferase type 12 n=2 Tax=Rhodopirellula TaxID=265488 RepID=M5U0K5_9BACT|nr:Methyltransferase type 12 [Rhodopirellula sallentina SM41]
MLRLKRDGRSRSRRGYDRLAPMYQTIERLAFGGQLQRGRAALVGDLPKWDQLLLMGDGDGRLLERLCAHARYAVDARCAVDERGTVDGEAKPVGSLHAGCITSVDQSEAMLRRQRHRVEAMDAARHVDFVCADALEWTPPRGVYDVLVLPFFLDCFRRDELERKLPDWIAGLREGGVVYYVDFCLPEKGWQRWRARLLLWTMHQFFRLQTGLQNRRLAEVRDLFAESGLRLSKEHISGGGMITTELWC